MKTQKKIFHILLSYLLSFIVFFILFVFIEKYTFINFYSTFFKVINAYLWALFLVFLNLFSFLFFLSYVVVSIFITYFWYKYHTLKNLLLLYFINGILSGIFAIISLHLIYFSFPGNGS